MRFSVFLIVASVDSEELSFFAFLSVFFLSLVLATSAESDELTFLFFFGVFPDFLGLTAFLLFLFFASEAAEDEDAGSP